MTSAVFNSQFFDCVVTPSCAPPYDDFTVIITEVDIANSEQSQSKPRIERTFKNSNTVPYCQVEKLCKSEGVLGLDHLRSERTIMPDQEAADNKAAARDWANVSLLRLAIHRKR